MAAACSAAQQTIVSRRRQAQAWPCIAMGLLALHSACAQIAVTHQAGKIAVDPTSSSSSSTDTAQLGSTGSSTTSAIPKYADGTQVTSANLNQAAESGKQKAVTTSSSTPASTISTGAALSSPAAGTTSTSTPTSTASTPADTASTPATIKYNPQAAAIQSTHTPSSASSAAGVNTGTQSMVETASGTPSAIGATDAASAGPAAHKAQSAAQGGATGAPGGIAVPSSAALTGFISLGSQSFSAGGGGMSMRASAQPAAGHVQAVSGGRKMML